MFVMSSDLGSSAHTSRIIRPILEFLFPNSPAETLDLYQWFIRKLAHFTEYGVLAILATRMFRFGRVALSARHWVIASILFVFISASFDEWHQTFVASRTPSPYDVMLDTAGGAFAVLLVWLITQRRGRAQG